MDQNRCCMLNDVKVREIILEITINEYTQLQRNGKMIN